MKLTSDQYGDLIVIYPKRKPNLKERSYTFSYKVNDRLSTCIDVSEAIYKTFVDGLSAEAIYKNSNWIVCCVRDDFVHTHAYVVGKDRFHEEDLELLFPPSSIIYAEKTNEVSDDLDDGSSSVDDSAAQGI